MAEFPGFTIWTDAYLADTGHLSTLEHGAYLLLLIAMWRAGGYLPNDDKRLARFCRLNDAQFAKVRGTLMEFFRVEGDQITQGRLQDEIEKARNRSSRAAENARAKYRKTLNTGKAGAVPEASQKTASISTSIDTVKKEPSVPKKGTRIPDDFEPDLDAAVAAGLRPERAITEAAKFKAYWQSATGAKATKMSWPKTWEVWFRTAIDRQGGPRSSQAQGKSAFRQHQDDVTAAFERELGIDPRATAYDDGQPVFDLDGSAFSSDRTRQNRK